MPVTIFLICFKGILETEVNFYFKLIPELMRLRAPMPKTFPVLWGDYKSTEKEILLLENLENEGFVSPQLSSEGIVFHFYMLCIFVLFLKAYLYS